MYYMKYSRDMLTIYDSGVTVSQISLRPRPVWVIDCAALRAGHGDHATAMVQVPNRSNLFGLCTENSGVKAELVCS